MTKTNTRRLVESAILIAVGTVLSLFKPIDLPIGGGITICAMAPMLLLSYRWGMKWGFFSSFVFGLLQLIIGVATNSFGLELWATIAMLLIDYLAAYTMLGFGGLFRNKIKNPVGALLAGGAVGVIARYLCHIASGAIFFGTWAEWFFTEGDGIAMGGWVLSNFSGWGLSIVYSSVFNGVLMIGELVLTLIGLAVIGAIPLFNKKMGGTKKETAPLEA